VGDRFPEHGVHCEVDVANGPRRESQLRGIRHDLRDMLGRDRFDLEIADLGQHVSVELRLVIVGGRDALQSPRLDP
jgi:hypothetical protein